MNSALDYQESFELKQPLPLFTKLNMEEILEKEMPPEEINELANVKPEVTFDDFKKLDMQLEQLRKLKNILMPISCGFSTLILEDQSKELLLDSEVFTKIKIYWVKKLQFWLIWRLRNLEESSQMACYCS